MLANFDDYDHVKIGDICRFKQPKDSFLWGQSVLAIPELYEPRNWMVVAFGFAKESNQCYIQRFHDKKIVMVSTSLVCVNRLRCSRQGHGGFWWKMQLLRELQPHIFEKTIAVLAELRRLKLTR